MAWNEPGNNNNDPWGDRKRGKQDGPPDLDEILKNTFGRLFGKKGTGGGSSNNNSGGGASGSVPSWVIPLIAIVVIGYYVIRGFGVVNEQERAVILRLGEFSEVKMPGIRWNPAFIDNVFTVNVTRVRSWSTNEQMLTQDLNIVDIKVSVQYVIEDPKAFVLNVKSPEDSLHQAANSALRHVVGSTVMHEVLTEGRSRIAIEVQQRLQEYLSNYTTGIFIEKVNVENSNPPVEVQSAFDDVIRAREDEERFKTEAQAYANERIPNARGNAQRMVEEALAYREQVIARAEGEAERFELLLAAYQKAPEVMRKRLYIEAMQDVLGNSSKILIDVEGGNNMMYLPLDKLIEAGERSSARKVPNTMNDVENLASRIADQVLQKAEARSNSRREGR